MQSERSHMMGRTMLEQRIQQHFFDAADALYPAAELHARVLGDAAQALVACVTAGGKVLACGGGASAALASYFCAVFVGRFERARPPLAAQALAADAAVLASLQAAGHGEQALAQQVMALGQAGDVLLVLESGGVSPELRAAVVQAHAKDMQVIALTSRSAGGLETSLGETDLHIAVGQERLARVRETQLVMLHALCDAVDLQLLGEQDSL
jgi:D-sedoheptulose 7-phosphate isomerase